MKSSLWADKRKKRLEIDKHECRLCGEKERLEVHHKPESYSKIPEESVEDDLTTLCVKCHDLITNRIRESRYESKSITTKSYKQDLIYKEITKNVESIKISPYRGRPSYLP